MLINAANQTIPVAIPDSVKLYGSRNDINMDKLLQQLKFLPDYIKATGDDVKKVTSMRTLTDAIKSSPVGRKLLSELST